LRRLLAWQCNCQAAPGAEAAGDEAGKRQKDKDFRF